MIMVRNQIIFECMSVGLVIRVTYSKFLHLIWNAGVFYAKVLPESNFKGDQAVKTERFTLLLKRDTHYRLENM